MPLPSSTDEVRAISEILGRNKGVVLLDDRATETNFKKEAAQSFRIMHLASTALLTRPFQTGPAWCLPPIHRLTRMGCFRSGK